MGWVKRLITKSVTEGTEEYLSGSIAVVLIVILMFVGYKMGDYAVGGHFGHLVEKHTWLQWIFQFNAFMGVGLSVYFVRAYIRTAKVARQRNGHSTAQIKDLMQEIEVTNNQLHVERERYRRIIDSQTEFVIKYLPDGTITFANRANYIFHGFTHWSEMLGTTIYDYMDPYTVGVVKEKLKLIKTSAPRERHTECMRSKIGDRIKYVDWINCGVFDSMGNLSKFQAVGRDVTVLVEAQERLRISEERYRLLFTHMVAGFAIHRIICDDEGSVCDYAFTEINPAFEELFGFSKEKVIGKTILEVMPNTEPNIIIRFGNVAETGIPVSFECEFKDIDKWFNVTAFKPQEEHFAATFVDITKSKNRTGIKTRVTDQEVK